MRNILIAAAAIIALSFPTPSKLTLSSDAYAQQEKKKKETKRPRDPTTGKKKRRADETYEECLERKRARGSGRRGRGCN
jgi:hypothetical protein